MPDQPTGDIHDAVPDHPYGGFSSDVIELLRAFGALARRGVLAVDLERGPGAYYFIPASRWLFHWNRLTLHDGPASVEAGFKKHELESLARRAGFTTVSVRRHRPWARLSLWCHT